MYIEFLKERGVLTQENQRKILAVMENSFVGICNHLTGLLYSSIGREEIQQLLDRVNALNEVTGAKAAGQKSV
jgi:hypothetical protein